MELCKRSKLDDFICPITKCVFSDPVILSDGHIYEKTPILKWLESNNYISPMTREKVDYTILPAPIYFKNKLKEFIELNKDNDDINIYEDNNIYDIIVNNILNENYKYIINKYEKIDININIDAAYVSELFHEYYEDLIEKEIVINCKDILFIEILLRYVSDKILYKQYLFEMLANIYIKKNIEINYKFNYTNKLFIEYILKYCSSDFILKVINHYYEQDIDFDIDISDNTSLIDYVCENSEPKVINKILDIYLEKKELYPDRYNLYLNDSDDFNLLVLIVRNENLDLVTLNRFIGLYKNSKFNIHSTIVNDKYDYKLIHVICMNKKYDLEFVKHIINIYLENSWNLYDVNIHCMAPIHFICRNREPEIINYILDIYIENDYELECQYIISATIHSKLNIKNYRYKHNLLHLLCDNDFTNDDVLNRLLSVYIKKGYCLTNFDENGYQILHKIAKIGSTNTINKLINYYLEKNFDLTIPTKDKVGTTLFHILCRFNKIESIELLINIFQDSKYKFNYNDELNRMNKYNIRPIDYILEYCDFKIINKVLDINFSNNIYYIPIYSLLHRNNTEIIINIIDKYINNNIPLHTSNFDNSLENDNNNYNIIKSIILKEYYDINAKGQIIVKYLNPKYKYDGKYNINDIKDFLNTLKFNHRDLAKLYLDMIINLKYKK